MSDQRIFQLESEIEEIKHKRGTLTVPISPIFPFLVMAAGVILVAMRRSSLGYPIVTLGFFGIVVIVFIRRSVEKRVKRIEEQIIIATIELEELKRG